jgi:two-component system, OmpR family, sensor histidine kinase TctE
VIQRFYRAPGSKSEGSGLGLAIASEIAHGHGAVMRLEDAADNKGLRVIVIFP